MPKERADIVASLSKKGFQPRQQKKRKGDHDFFFFRFPNLTRPVYTKVSRGTNYRTISDDLLGKMSRQLHLTRAEFDALVDCAMEKPDYITVLKSRGVLS